jgi:hypothetical protein
MPGRDRFELRRQSDELVYRFTRVVGADGAPAWRREDLDVWIRRHPKLGWVAWDDENNVCTGRPWAVLPEDQGDDPPEGDWVSRKGPKSYAYSLVYVDR